MQAAEMLENYRKVAVEQLGTKDEQLTNLQNKMVEMGEAFENYKIAANASIKEVTETCEQKVQEQKDQIQGVFEKMSRKWSKMT